LARFTAILAGAAAMLTPAAAGIIAFLNPLRQKTRAGEFIRVTNLDSLPEDGSPQKFPVIADRRDAWNLFPNEPIGAVYLRRTGNNKVEALQVVCPHAGCTIMLESGKDGKKFLCPCHTACFDLAGKRLDAASPSPRDMDSLDAEIRENNEVWVKFQNFTPGISRKFAQG
jgi:menaquinol-cytochrome c reductase iron-sulfur subunit